MYQFALPRAIHKHFPLSLSALGTVCFHDWEWNGISGTAHPHLPRCLPKPTPLPGLNETWKMAPAVEQWARGGWGKWHKAHSPMRSYRKIIAVGKDSVFLRDNLSDRLHGPKWSTLKYIRTKCIEWTQQTVSIQTCMSLFVCACASIIKEYEVESREELKWERESIEITQIQKSCTKF